MLLRTPVYLYIIAVAVLLVLLVGQQIQRLRYFHHLVGLVDAMGLGAYAVVGLNRAIAIGLSLPGIIVVGMVNAVGGGILRDVLMRREPRMFQPGTLEESLALLGCVLFMGFVRGLSIGQYPAAWFTIGVVFIVRIWAVRYGISSRPLRGFKAYWEKSEQE
jgi:uncharacterized membrane protein YeiH